MLTLLNEQEIIAIIDTAATENFIQTSKLTPTQLMTLTPSFGSMDLAAPGTSMAVLGRITLPI